MAVFANGAFVSDPWRMPGADGHVATGSHAILTLAQWREHWTTFAGASNPIGLLLEPGAPLAELAADLKRFALIVLAFPKYTDGRAYSMAHQLRDMGYGGQLRATGNVLFDQLQLMTRCGFDSFEISHAPTLRLLESGRRPDVANFYQPGFGAEIPAGTRPWARKRA